MRKSRKVEVRAYDKDTGELLDGVPVWCGVRNNPYNQGWVMNNQIALEMIAKDKEITGGIHRVLWFLASRIDFENWIQISQQEICKELGMKKQHVSSAIKILEEKEILLRGPKVGRSYAFRLNPEFGWKGKVKNLNEYRRQKEDEEIKELQQQYLEPVDNSSEQSE